MASRVRRGWVGAAVSGDGRSACPPGGAPEAGLPRKRFHDLRHTCATLLLLQGVDLRVVMEVLGHSQIPLTANTYAHVAETLKLQAAERMEALFARR